MQLRDSFGVSKFKSLLLAGSFTVLANYIVRLSDSIIAGNMIGESALAGINLVGPCLSVVSFIAGLIATGVGTRYSMEMGRCDRRRACEFFMQGIWSILLVGGLLGAVFAVYGGEYVVSYAASAEITVHACEYLKWVWPVAVLEGMVMLLVTLGYADGDTPLCAAAYAVVFVGNFVTSSIAVKLGMGTAGCGLGSVIAELMGVLVISAHFLRKTCSFRPVAHFSVMDMFRICASSFGDAAAFLCDGSLFFFLNKFIIVNFGSELLPVVGVATMLWGFLELFNGVGIAAQPIVTVYYGERNSKSIRTVMISAMKWSLVEGVFFMVVLGLFPNVVVRAVGIDEPELVRQSIAAIRLMSFGFVALAFAGLFNSYYMFVEKATLAGVITFLCYLIMPIACIAICSIGGINGVWLGMGLGPFLGLAITSLIIISTSGIKAFPLLLDRSRDGRLHVFDLMLTDKEIADTSRAIGEIEGVPMKAALMVEEVFMTVKDRAQATGRTLHGEAVLDMNDGIELTLRDDGEIFDITDTDLKVSSLRTYLVSSMMCAHHGKMNLATTGFNRNVFRF